MVGREGLGWCLGQADVLWLGVVVSVLTVTGVLSFDHVVSMLGITEFQLGSLNLVP